MTSTLNGERMFSAPSAAAWVMITLALTSGSLSPLVVASRGNDVHLALSSSDTSGIRVYYVDRGSLFGTIQYRVTGTMTSDYRPWHLEFIQPDGTVTPFFRSTGLTPDGDLASWGDGDGVVYGGGPGMSVASPAVTDWHQQYDNSWYENLQSNAGWLVIAWANQAEPISFDIKWPPGTNVHPVSSGELDAFELKDFKGGAHVSIPAGAIAHVADSLNFEPNGHQMWEYFVIYRSTGYGMGNFAVDRVGDAFHREISFGAVPSGCLCYQLYRWVFTSESAMSAQLTLLGDGRRTAIFAVIGSLPVGTLPSNAWQEFDDSPTPP